MSDTDRVTVSTVVAVEPATAFKAFTEEVDAWWLHGPRYRYAPERASAMRFEPGVGGRLLEVYDEERGEAHELGRLLVWEPGQRLVYESRARDYAPHQRTEVEVRFERVEGGTRVTVEHRGFDTIPEGAAARHGLEGEAFLGMMGLWWADLLTRVRAHAGGGR